MINGPIEQQQLSERLPFGFGGRFYGVYQALVTKIDDPEGLGRIEVCLSWSPDSDNEEYRAWARIATLMAGSNRGSWFIPDVGDEVLISFESGDPRHPYVLGGLWNGADTPHESMESGEKNNIKSIRSRNGVKITIDDNDGQESLALETPGGQKITLKDGPGMIELQDSNGNSVTMDTSGIAVNASARVTVNANMVEITASMVTVNAGISKFSGIVQADTVISNSVISASYTPGAGNIW